MLRRQVKKIHTRIQINGDIYLWKIEDDIKPLKRVGKLVFNKFSCAPIKGWNETTKHPPFCKDILEEIVRYLRLQDYLLVLGDTYNRKEDQIYPDLLIELRKFYQQLSNQKAWVGKLRMI